jgi:uncharacterized protein YfaS (alpha-2-macroglobulin family)
MKNYCRALAIGLVLVVLLSVGAYELFKPKSSPTPVSTKTILISSPRPESTALPPRPIVGYTPVPAGTVSPIVIHRLPEAGQEFLPDGIVQLTFDRRMDRSSVESAFAIQPSVAGRLEWGDARTLFFKPDRPLARGALYDVILDQRARAADGASLRDVYQFRFVTAGFLQVGQAIPAPDSTGIETSATVTVIFNRPVVPLTLPDQQSNFPLPLTFDPPVSGRGEWLNTSIYIFRPDRPLAGGTTYTVAVRGMRDTSGNPLAEAYVWRFTTQPLDVRQVSPQDEAEEVSTRAAIHIKFNQPIDAGSAASAFSLKAADELFAGWAVLPGTFEVFSDTLTFTPTARLPFNTLIEARVAAGVKAVTGVQGTPRDFVWRFKTAPLPRIAKTEPANGDYSARPHTPFEICFNTRIDPTTVMPNIQMTPPLSPTQVYTRYSGECYSIGFDAQPSTNYVVKIGPNIADPDGNITGQSLTVHFRTSDLDPVDPGLRLRVPHFVGTYSAYTPVRLYALYVNVKRVDLSLYRLEPEGNLQAWERCLDEDYKPPASALIRRWSQPLDAQLNETGYAPIDLAKDGGLLAPGIYLLDAYAPGLSKWQGRWGLRHLMIVSEVNLTLKSSQYDALAWATDMQSGQPVSDLNITFYDENLLVVGAATTGSDGVARISLGETQHKVELAFSEDSSAMVLADWGRGVEAWDFGLDFERFSEHRTHIYTDRPIYRPGQTVHFKGIVRAEKDMTYSLPWKTHIHVTVRGPDGGQLRDEDLPLDDHGAFDGEVKLAGDAALGSYDIWVGFGQYDPSGTSFQFRVAAYRPPEFEVTVKPGQAEIVHALRAVTATVQVKYYSGGALAGAPVEWYVLAEDYVFRPAWGGNYSFRDVDDPWCCFDCWCGQYRSSWPLLYSGSGTTDEQGRLEVEIPESGFQVPVTASQRLVILAEVTGSDNQHVSGQAEIIAHSGDYYVGLAAEKYVGEAGTPFKVNLVAVDWRGDNPRLPGKALTVQVYRREWKNTFVDGEAGGGHWRTEAVDTLVDTLMTTTDARGEAVASFTPMQSGSYRIVAIGSSGNIRSSIFAWVAGEGYVSWQRENSDRINLIADKVTYMPGETAEILIPSLYQGPHVALVTVERGGLLKYEVVPITSSSQVYRLPLTADYAPNVYVSVVLVKGVDTNQKVASYKVGIVPLEVKATRQRLNITLTPDPVRGEPGQSITYTIRATDAAGQPVRAELSLDLVDKAVLSLAPRQANVIFEAFYGERGLGVQTASGLAASGYWLLVETERELNSGGYFRMYDPIEDPLASEATLSPLAPSRPRGDLPQNLPFMPDVQIRQEFADTAYWNASVVTDHDGEATVIVKLPDNLTTWVMRGVGFTLDTQVGEGTAELVSTKPLLIRPVTPRFFVVGDRAQVAAVVSNHTKAALRASVVLSATGVKLSTPAEQIVTIDPQGETKVTWDVSVYEVFPAGGGPEEGAVELVFGVIAEEYSDASKPRLATGPGGSLRVLRYSVPDSVSTAGDLLQAGTRTEVIALPPKYDERQGDLLVQLDPSLAAAMQDSLKYLENYEYECAEQIVSRFLPNVLTYRTLKELGISDKALEARLPDLVQQGLNRLYDQQRDDGGWGWWRDSRESNVHLTAYAVFALIKTRQSGFEVRDDVVRRGEQFLITGLVHDLTFASSNRQAFTLYVLAEGGYVQEDELNELFDNRDKLSHYGRAYLALSLWLNDPSDTRIATLMSDLNSAAILSATGAHWEESYYDRWAMNTDTRSTAIVLDALARIQAPGQASGALAPNVVRWLMVARKGDHWETTQEAAWALIALTDWMKATGELKGNYDYAVFLNDRDVTSGQVNSRNIRESIKLHAAVADLLKESNRLMIERGIGPGHLYYTAHLRVFLPVEEVEAVSRGIIVDRRYSLVSCADGPQCPDVREAKLGDVIRVDLTVVAPNDLYYVILEDPLPAGGEAIDTGLATTSLLDESPTFAHQAWWHWYTRSELRDEKVVLFADYVPKGAYEYSYTFRATLPGDYHVLPTVAREFYFPEVFGRSDGRLLSIYLDCVKCAW